MAAYRLLLVVAFSVVLSRPSMDTRAGSPESGWWQSGESAKLLAQARKQVAAGDYAAAEQTYSEGVARANAHGYKIAAARFLSGVASARRARYDYQGALKAYQQSKQTFEGSQDWLDLGAINLNISALYEEVWDPDSAYQAAQEGLAAARKSPAASYEPQLRLQTARLAADREAGRPAPDHDPAGPFLAAIQSARSKSDFDGVEALGWSLLGSQLLSRGDLKGAEKAFLKAFSLRRLFFNRDLMFSYFDLGELRLAQAEASERGAQRGALLREAEYFARQAEGLDRQGSSGLNGFLLRQQRGRIRLALGDVTGALEQLGAAVELAGKWRSQIPMAFASVGAATARTEERVFSQFIETAADYGIKTSNSKLIAESFLAQELTRAANLGGGQALVRGLRERLPARFWLVLAQIRAEEARLEGGAGGRSDTLDRLRLELTGMEAEANFGLNYGNLENFRASRSLTQYRQGLSDSEVLFSFHLGTRQSFLWAVTRNSLSAYRLPSKEQIRSLVQGFREVLESGNPTRRLDLEEKAPERAKELYGVLFGQANQTETGKRDWLISPEDALLELPFAALIPNHPSGGARYLVESHSLQIISGTRPSLARKWKYANGPLLAVGDPIYNLADPRLGREQTGFWAQMRSWFVASTPYAVQLNRLPGSGREVEALARIWSPSTVLVGAAATKTRFEQALQSTQPAAIHLATHVFALHGETNEALLAFGLGDSRRPELMGTSEVALLHIPGSLVTMTGCESAGGDLRAGVGLENLTRAWTLAGAAAVVATQWPVKDSGGEFLSQFYDNLRRADPAEALQKTQSAMIHSGTWMSAPAIWASYQLYGGAE
ncbi:MAG TPA: CHAT domain-containing protein [Bryobacteraceae bacterium]|nr:CHAT domain-containing protein [Bryobacteraceae bacterium]